MRLPALILIGIVLAAPLSPAGARTGTVAADPRRLVDRTLLCSTVPAVGYGFIRIGATSPAGLQAAGAFASTTGVEQSLAGLQAGPAGGRTTGGVHYDRRLCRLTTKRVPLTSRGLPGPPVLFEQYLRCEAGARIFVRLRTLLDRRAVWRRSQDLLVARGNFTSATFAVRTGTGKPLAFFTLGSGKSRLWTAGNCDR